MVDVITSIVIGRSHSEVCAYASDPDNVPSWYANIRSVEWVTPRPARLGSKIAFKARFLGRDLSYVYEIVEWSPPESLVMRAGGPFAMETSYRWEPLGPDSTRMVLRNRGDPKGFSRLVTPLMTLAMRRANRKDLARLKSILEGG